MRVSLLRPCKKLGRQFYRLRWSDGGRRRERSTKTRDKRVAERARDELELKLQRGRYGLDDPFDHQQARPLAEHLEDFLAGLKAKGRDPRHIAGLRFHLERAFDAMRAKYVGELADGDAATFLAELADTRSATTVAKAGQALRQFGRWLYRSKRVPYNALEAVPIASRSRTLRAFRRYPLTLEELSRLVVAAEERPVQEWLRTHPSASVSDLAVQRRRGWDRGTLYLFAARIGLRKGECAGLIWHDLHLDGEEPFVVVREEEAKNRTYCRVPLVADIAARLVQFRERTADAAGGSIAGSASVFRVPDKIATLLRKDAAWAKIDSGTERLDFHCLRTTLAQHLADAGIDQALAATITRHNDPRVLTEHYQRTKTLSERNSALDRATRAVVPPAVPPGAGRQAARVVTSCHDRRERGEAQRASN